MDINAKLQQTRKLLNELGNHLSALVNAAPDIFKDELLQRQLDAFRHEYQESTQRLANPSLVIATLGTTSSGKSTIVNALMGRRLAPIEAGEMSGGVLRIIHSEQRKLVIEDTPEAAWETGTWENLGDGELYERVQSVMHRYHEARKKKDFIAPQIQVQAPLLPACDLSLSGLPQGIGVEFLDLPGLKSVQDRANLAVIQPQVGKAFSLVALDYMQVDEQHRQKLLGELKDVVKFLQGRTESMIFILNRVDARGSDDFPLEVRLSKLKEEIRDTLELPGLPDVIPFSARLLYYAQCAWGTNHLNGSPSVSIETQTRLLKALFKDCGSIIQEKRGSDRELRDWLQRISNDLEDGYEVENESLRKIVRYALAWSGGAELWQCINHRVNESSTDLVILPVLKKLFDRFDSLAESLDLLIKNRKIYNQEQLMIERKNISNIRKQLKEKIRQVGEKFQQEVKDYTEALQQPEVSRDTSVKVDAREREKAREENKMGFSQLGDVINGVEGDLTRNLISRVRDAFRNNQPSHDLEDVLKEVISPSLANDVARAYGNVCRRILNFSKQGESLYRKVLADDSPGKISLEHDEKYFRLLYYTMRKAITAKAEFLMQSRVKEFEEALDFFVNDQLHRLGIALTDLNLDAAAEMQEATINELRRRLQEKPIKLPEDLFNLNATIERTEITQREVVGTEEYDETVTGTREEQKVEYYKVGFCFPETKQRTINVPVQYTEVERKTRDRYGDVSYFELLLPSPDLMAKQWAEGITKAKTDLWDTLCDWIIERLNAANQIFEESIDDITGLAERTLIDQLQVIETDFEEAKQFWQSFESIHVEVKDTCKRLESFIRSDN